MQPHADVSQRVANNTDLFDLGGVDKIHVWCKVRCCVQHLHQMCMYTALQQPQAARYYAPA